MQEDLGISGVHKPFGLFFFWNFGGKETVFLAGPLRKDFSPSPTFTCQGVVPSPWSPGVLQWALEFVSSLLDRATTSHSSGAIELEGM